MPRKRYPFMRHEKNRHGHWRWYVRRGSKRTRLPDEYGTPEFWEAYHAAIAGQPKKVRSAVTGTLAWLVARFKESVQFQQGAETTRYFRDRILRRVVDAAGDAAIEDVTRSHIETGMADRSAKPHSANHFLTAMNLLFDWAVRNDHVKVNPCVGVRPMKIKIVGHHTWTVDEVEQFRARHAVGTRARLALDLLLFTGLRSSDITKIGPQHVKDSVLSYRTRKTGAMVYIPIFPELRASIAAVETNALAYIISSRGIPFSGTQAFGAWFVKRCGEAGLPSGRTPHGLRKAGATIAANAGASPHELMAMYGWTRLSMAEAYTKESDKKRLAHGAAERIANTFSPHPEKGVEHGTKKLNGNNAKKSPLKF